MSTSGSRVRVTLVGRKEIVVAMGDPPRASDPNVVTYASRGEGPDPAMTEQVRPVERDPLVAALARYVEALHRRYPDGPHQMRRERLAVAPDSANVVPMNVKREAGAA